MKPSYPNVRVLCCLFFLLSLRMFAQPSNDNCSSALTLPNGDYCSAWNTYTLAEATDSGQNGSCFAGANTDVWFSFVATNPFATITVSGLVSEIDIINIPEVAIYSGNCDSLSQVACNTNQNSGLSAAFVQLVGVALTIGETYYIQVDEGSFSTGFFQLCVLQYDQVLEASADCATAQLLCSNTQYVTAAPQGGGLDQNEYINTPCIPTTNDAGTAWFAWQAEAGGLLSFTLLPLNPADDLDFVLFSLPNGYGDCANKVTERCMSSGEITPDSPCMGDTGLGNGDTDLIENPGCVAPQNGWAAPIMMTAGKVYLLAVRNYTNFNNGFSILFNSPTDSTLTDFTIPTVDISVVGDLPTCATTDQNVQFTADENFLVSNNAYVWSFSQNISPDNATGCCPSVNVNGAGDFFAIATFSATTGCVATDTFNFTLEGSFEYTYDVSSPACAGANNGAVLINATPDTDIYTIVLANDTIVGATEYQFTGLGPGNYPLEITNSLGCVIEFNGINVSEGLALDFVAMADTGIYAPASVILTAGTDFPSVISWQDDQGNFLSGSAPLVTPASTTTYYVTAESQGCVSYDTVVISVADAYLKIPSAFSPNGDNINDEFLPVGEGVTLRRFDIYDRWGEQVHFDWTAPFIGQLNGLDLPSDVYVYIIEAVFPDGSTEIFQGDLTLLR